MQYYQEKLKKKRNRIRPIKEKRESMWWTKEKVKEKKNREKYFY